MLPVSSDWELVDVQSKVRVPDVKASSFFAVPTWEEILETLTHLLIM